MDFLEDEIFRERFERYISIARKIEKDLVHKYVEKIIAERNVGERLDGRFARLSGYFLSHGIDTFAIEYFSDLTGADFTELEDSARQRLADTYKLMENSPSLQQQVSFMAKELTDHPELREPSSIIDSDFKNANLEMNRFYNNQRELDDFVKYPHLFKADWKERVVRDSISRFETAQSLSAMYTGEK